MTIAYIVVHPDEDYQVFALTIEGVRVEQYVVDNWETALAVLSLQDFDRLHVTAVRGVEDVRDFLDDTGGY